jgi:hypothetical protein
MLATSNSRAMPSARAPYSARAPVFSTIQAVAGHRLKSMTRACRYIQT